MIFPRRLQNTSFCGVDIGSCFSVFEKYCRQATQASCFALEYSFLHFFAKNLLQPGCRGLLLVHLENWELLRGLLIISRLIYLLGVSLLQVCLGTVPIQLGCAFYLQNLFSVCFLETPRIFNDIYVTCYT